MLLLLFFKLHHKQQRSKHIQDGTVEISIKYCVELGLRQTKMLKMNRSGSTVSRALVCRWHKRFSDRRASCDDDEHPG